MAARCSAVIAVVLVLVASASAQTPVEVLGEIRVHGNYRTPDAEVVRLAALTVGQALAPDTVAAAKARLEHSGRFVSVEVRKRYRSLDDASDVALIIVVQEYPESEAVPSPLRPLRRTFRNAMFMPILDYTDGYGFTYGGRVSFVEGLGKDARLSVPLSWGGLKRAAVQFEKRMASGPVDRVTAGASISRRTNPHYEIDDDRQEGNVGASRQIARFVRAGGHAGISNVTFAGLDSHFTLYGADVTLDTRADPVFARNAVFASVGWEHLDFRAGPAIDRFRFDARGYVALIGQSVLSVRALVARADRPLPAYEQYLLGGAETLRGYRAGTFAGDRLVAASAEVRVPISSPLSFGKFGVDVFTDVGTIVGMNTRLADAAFHQGFGGGVFLLASVFQLNCDVAVRPDGGARVHVMSGFRF